MPHQTSKNIFYSAITVLPWRQTRYNILNDITKVQNATKRPILTLSQKEYRRNWAFKYMKQNWQNLIFTDDCRVNLDGPDGCKRGWGRENWSVRLCSKQQQRGAQYYFGW